MYVTRLDLLNFRNYERLSLDLGEGTNLFYGKNAQGKTNILEAVFLSGTTRSHRGSKDREMIRKGEEESHIRMDVVKKDTTHRIDMHLKKNKSKGIAIDRIPVRKAGELYGIVNFVFFSPEDLGIIKNGPAQRRKFVNLELSQTDRVYLSALTDYHRCLQQRGKLLRSDTPDKIDPAQIDVWDLQLVRCGRELIVRRKQFIEKMNEILSEIHPSITGGKETLRLVYEPNVSAESFAEKLCIARDTDLRLGETVTGPHRDDIAVMIGEMDARVYGSQGQQRSCALSLKLAEIELLKQQTGDTPVLLLDDVLSELDEERQKALLGRIEGIQTFITCTGLDEFVKNNFQPESVFYVENGIVSR